ncbi:hypothetical protein T552_01505 [Pneumocystis carinii B80]|uniref:Exocyst complex component Sec8 n=1 Tax=Pneumocystis carinii (strain B80) TaxID=1408658 RepID=A0A0W4ZKI0_PNEC8|nr:hypothetical protein T552_01505 [Pneumocystis carinii B80]KTW28876.1 hypothetical protein T552_01505 [Pneumocystis carinii B80]
MEYYREYLNITENNIKESQEKANERKVESWKQSYKEGLNRGDIVNKTEKYELSEEIEDILQYIKEKWNSLTKEECNSVVSALELFDKSSLGKDYNAFKETYQRLQKAFKSIINEHYDEFSSSIGTFEMIMQNIAKSLEKTNEINEMILESQERFSFKENDLNHIYQHSSQLKETLRILKAIDDFRRIPDILEKHISEKKFLTAINLLREAQQITEKYEMSKIGALADIKQYISGQKNSLMDIILEELHNHLYLKSPYCDAYWAPYVIGKEELPIPNALKRNKESQSNTYFSYDNENLQSEVKKNNVYNPEVDSEEYIRMLTKALYLLDVFPVAIDIIVQRLPVEIYQLIDKTINEVEQRDLNLLQNMFPKQKSLNIIDTDFSEDIMKSEILKDFFWTLYSKLIAVLNRYNIMYIYISDLSSIQSEENEGITSGLVSFNFLNIWKPIESEIQTLLSNYVVDGPCQIISTSSNFISFNDMFDEKKDIRRTKMFNIRNINENSKDFNDALDDLKNILNSSVVYLMLRGKNVKDKMNPIPYDLKETSFTAHRMLVKSSVFNIEALFKPTLAFLRKCQDTTFLKLCAPDSIITPFLDEFLSNTFFPQLKDIIQEISNQSILDFDVFQIYENWSIYSTNYVLKSAVSLLALITNLSKILNSISYNNEDYSYILLDILIKYYNKCSLKYKELISLANHITGNDKTIVKNIKKMSEIWSDNEELKELLKQFLDDSITLDNFSVMETEKEFSLKNKVPLKYNDIQWDKQVLESLGILYHTLKWILDMITSNSNIKTNLSTDSHKQILKSFFKPSNKVVSILRNESDNSEFYMKSESIEKLEAILVNFKELSKTILFTIRIEIRCHVMYYIEKVVRDGNYYLDHSIPKPDLYLLELNTELLEYNEQLNSCLQYDEYLFVFYGLPYLIDNLLVLSAENIKKMNTIGSEKMLLNIMILQQNLKNVIRDVENVKLEKSIHYYELLKLGPKNLLEEAKKPSNIFTYDEVKTLLHLQYSEDLVKADELNRPDITMTLKHSLNENLIELNEYLWQK